MAQRSSFKSEARSQLYSGLTSPLSQMNPSPLFDSRWASRDLRDTPQLNASSTSTPYLNLERKAQVTTKLQSKSDIRKWLFNMKRKMILFPLRDVTVSITAGFLVNTHLILSVCIAYEKLVADILSYSQSLIPLICLGAFLLTVCLLALVVLMLDMVDKGCLAWNRDSFGILFQRIVFSTCFLCSVIYLYAYVKKAEENLENPQVQCKAHKFIFTFADHKINIISCFIPLMICIGLLMIKLIFFRVRYVFFYVMLSLSFIAFALLLSYEFDVHNYHLNLLFCGIPIVLFFVTLASFYIYVVVLQPLLSKNANQQSYIQEYQLIHGYDNRCKKIMAIVIFSLTIMYCVGLLVCFYLKDFGHWDSVYEMIMIMTIIYFTATFQQSGEIVLDIIFQQFYFDLIDGSPIKNKYQIIYQKRMQQVNVDKERLDQSVELQERGQQADKEKFGKIRLQVRLTAPTKPSHKDLKSPLLNYSSGESQQNQ